MCCACLTVAEALLTYSLCWVYICSQQADAGAVNPMRMPDAERRVVRGRMGGLQLHPSFNRKFRDPFSNMASWQIDDCARALQCFLPMLLRPARSGQREMPLLQPELAKKAFGHLKRFTAFHLGHVPFETAEEYRKAAKASVDELIAYGAVMEQVRALPLLQLEKACSACLAAVDSSLQPPIQ